MALNVINRTYGEFIAEGRIVNHTPWIKLYCGDIKYV